MAFSRPRRWGKRRRMLSPRRLEQKIRIAQLITKASPPLTSSAFSIAVGAVVPPQVEVHSLPVEAAQVAPQLRDAGYVVVEEQIALVDQRTRRVELVFPRWREP